MANMSLEKIKMPEQAPDVRNKNFKEVSLGYTEEMAIEEAQRCLNCKHKPCVSGCPVNVRIPEFIAEVAKGDFMAAYKVITSTNALPAVCGRVCPQESQCESKCVRGMKGEAVGIGRLERFVADWYMKNCDELPEKPASNGKKVAVIGSGPSALACAGDLAKQGYEVTMFEAFHKAGGVLVYGIPEFRLPKAIADCGYSGNNTSRPAYRKLLAAIRADEVSDVVVYELSRLNRDFENQSRLLLELKAHNVTLHSIQEQIVGLDEPVFRALLKEGCE